MKTTLYIALGILAAVIVAGIIKFNILANLDGYDVDGNRISMSRTVER